jgi:predicted SAM-dependent methyltransferase
MPAKLKALSVGGGTSRELPSTLAGYECHVLDIDPAVNPDVCCDALKMDTLAPESYDAVFCSHNLEHFYAHEVPVVLAGLLHVLKPDCDAQIIVPNLTGLFDAMRQHNLDLGDVWYRTGSGNAITFHDVLYGWGPVMAEGNLYYAHKCGFTPAILGKVLQEAGFENIRLWTDAYNLYARATKCQSQ